MGFYSEFKSMSEKIERQQVEINTLTNQLRYKNDEIHDLAYDCFYAFRRMEEIASRNDYGNNMQKISQIKSYATDMKEMYAKYITEDDKIKELSDTNHSQK